MYIFLVTATKAWCDFLWLHFGTHSSSTVQYDLSWKSGCCGIKLCTHCPSRPTLHDVHVKKKKESLCTLVTVFCSHAEVCHSPAECISSQLRLNNTCLLSNQDFLWPLTWKITITLQRFTLNWRLQSWIKPINTYTVYISAYMGWNMCCLFR